MSGRRPWLVWGRSDRWAWNGPVGRRFASEARAKQFAAFAAEELGWDAIWVGYNPTHEQLAAERKSDGNAQDVR